MELARAKNLAQRAVNVARRGELLQAIPRWLGRLSGKAPVGEGVNLSFLDTELGLDTGGIVHFPAMTADGVFYYGIAASTFAAMMTQVQPDRGTATFVDFGSGKGRAVFLAAQYGFQRIVGIEILASLHEIAGRNVEIFRRATSSSVSIELVLGDVATSAIPAGPLLAYFYNPFGDKTLRQVLRNLEAAHRLTGQRIDIAYGHPVFEKLLDEQAWLRKTGVVEEAFTREEMAQCAMGLKSLRIACYTTLPE